MLSVSGELRNISHPMVRSFHQRQEFDTSNRSRRVLIIETKFNFGKKTGKAGEEKLMTLLADLEGILAAIEQKAGKFDCVDIEPLQYRPTEHPAQFAA